MEIFPKFYTHTHTHTLDLHKHMPTFVHWCKKQCRAYSVFVWKQNPFRPTPYIIAFTDYICKYQIKQNKKWPQANSAILFILRQPNKRIDAIFFSRINPARVCWIEQNFWLKFGGNSQKCLRIIYIFSENRLWWTALFVFIFNFFFTKFGLFRILDAQFR